MDEQILFYIVAAVIYLLTRKRKRKQHSAPETSEASPPQKKSQPLSFEDLLKEITDQREPKSEIEEISSESDEKSEERVSTEDHKEGRKFADDESRKIYEESIRRAQKIDHEHKLDKTYATEKLVRSVEVNSGSSFADEIREGLTKIDTARKAIIYAEILNRRY